MNNTNGSASIWHELLEDARFAPSPHNVQPWKLRVISDREATLLYDPHRLIPDEDLEGSYTLAAFGILIEYMAIIAQAKGLCLTHAFNGNRLDRHATELTPLFHLTLSPSDSRPTVDPALIGQRRTSRLPYNDTPIPQPVLAELSDIAAEYGHTFTFSADPAVVRWVVKLNGDTLFYDMKDDVTRREVNSWIRYTRRDAGARKDGLTAFCLLMPGAILKLFFQHQAILKLPFVTRISKWYYIRTMRGTTTVGWISGPFFTPGDWLDTGHMLGRIWLKMTEHSVYLHPFGSTITNPIAHKQLREKFAVDESRSPLWLIMRLGHSDIPPRSYRLNVADIIVEGPHA